MEEVRILDPETEFLASKKQTGNEWELFKENVRPMKRGRNVNVLNEALKSQTNNHLKKSLIEERRRLITAIDEYKGEDPLQPWIECIKWVQESFPTGGDCSGLVVIYEQCVRTFWHSEQYKDDLRYLKVWMEYAENCADAEVIYNFLDANGIGQTYSLYYISYALHMESKNKLKKANDIFNLGIDRKAQPIEKLEAAFKKFITRSMRRPTATIEEESADSRLPVRSFGTVLARGEARRQAIEKSDLARKKVKLDSAPSMVPIYMDIGARTGPSHQPELLKNDVKSWNILGTRAERNKDIGASTGPSHQPELLKNDVKSWNILGTRAERNKENTAIPSKWTSNKIPQKPGFRSVAAAGPCIPVFVDEECAESETVAKEDGKSSLFQLRRVDGVDLKKETDLLKVNPLRNFPPNSLPR